VGGARRGPRVGELTLQYEAVVLADDGDQILTLYTAESGTLDAEHLARLASDATFAA